MKDEKETREKLLASARQEFLEKGYTQASLRSICKNAGVTTGALYFFFQDKVRSCMPCIRIMIFCCLPLQNRRDRNTSTA